MQWSQNLCRTCGQISENCHFIYNKEVPSILENKIKKYLQLDLCKADYKPKQICNNCVMKLNDLSDFIDVCYLTNKKLESIYYDSQNWHDKNYNCSGSLNRSVIVSNHQAIDNVDFQMCKNTTGIMLEASNIANYSINNSEMLDLVSNREYKHNLNTFATNEKESDQYSSILKHPNNMQISLPTVFSSLKNLENQRIDDQLCYTEYDSSYNRKSNDGISTTLCQENVNVDPRKRKTVTVYAVQKSLTVPLKKYNKEKVIKSYKCPICDRIFSRRGSLNSHMANHTNRRPYKCDECCKTFAIRSDLTTHKKTHNGKYKCSFCIKKFAFPSKLDRHIRIHTNEKPYMCDFSNCGKTFSDKRNLEGHKFTHTTEKKFSCKVCNKKFKTTGRLKQHSKCHSNNTVYTCDLCSKQYKYKNNLISHIKKHNNICPYCKKTYESNTLLIEHKKSCSVRN